MASTDPLLTDLRLELRHYELRPVYVAATEPRVVPRQPRQVADLGRVGGRANLEQAILMRLLTPRGELAGLGHPEYGSRLHEMVGSENTPTARNRIKLYVLECLQAEPRIEEVLDVTVQPAAGRANRDRVDVTLRVRPLGDAEALAIGPLTLELGS